MSGKTSFILDAIALDIILKAIKETKNILLLKFCLRKIFSGLQKVWVYLNHKGTKKFTLQYLDQ